MTLLTLLTQLLAVVSALSFIWLLVRAFGKHVLWGLGVLLLSPFSATAFGVTYWKEEKKPFLLYLGSTLGALGLTLYLFSAWGGWDLIRTTSRLQQGIASQRLSVADAKAYLQASQTFVERSGIEVRDPVTLSWVDTQIEQEQARLAAQEEARREQAEADHLGRDTITKKVKSDTEPRYRLVYKPIMLSDARKYIGATVKVTRRNTLEKEYRLTGASANRLQFSQRNSSGAYSFSYHTRDIEKLRVLIKESY